MFREIILPIFRGTRLCVTVCGIMHRRCCRPTAGNIVGARSDSTWVVKVNRRKTNRRQRDPTVCVCVYYVCIYVGESKIIRNVGACFAVGYTAGWA